MTAHHDAQQHEDRQVHDGAAQEELEQSVLRLEDARPIDFPEPFHGRANDSQVLKFHHLIMPITCISRQCDDIPGMDHVIPSPAAQQVERLRAVELLLSRQSVNLLQEPAPDGAELDLILDAGMRAPDHGRLRPWRFVLIRGEQRKAWADRLAEAAMARDPANGPAMAEKARAWVGRTPLIIAVGVEIKEGKIPEIEQVLSAGAAAMNMLNAIHLLGYGGLGVKGGNGYALQVNKALGFEPPSRLVGFLGVGTPRPMPADAPKIARPSRAQHARDWIA